LFARELLPNPVLVSYPDGTLITLLPSGVNVILPSVSVEEISLPLIVKLST